MGRNGVTLSATRKVENRALRWYEHTEQVMKRLLGNGHHNEERRKRNKSKMHRKTYI
jgi:hypothetical protein